MTTNSAVNFRLSRAYLFLAYNFSLSFFCYQQNRKSQRSNRPFALATITLATFRTGQLCNCPHFKPFHRYSSAAFVFCPWYLSGENDDLELSETERWHHSVLKKIQIQWPDQFVWHDSQSTLSYILNLTWKKRGSLAFALTSTFCCPENILCVRNESTMTESSKQNLLHVHS